MTHLPPRTVHVCALLVLLTVTAGCLGITSQSELPDRETVSESLHSIETVEGNVSVERQVGNETVEIEMEFVQRLSTGEFRATVHQNSSDRVYDIVSNGSTMWVYNQTANTVRSVELEGVGSGWNQSVESISDMFASLKESSEKEDVTISPLPAVPGGGSGTGAVGAGSLPSTGNISLTYQGTATTLGQETHVVDLEATTNESLIRNGTIWFDADHFYPIKTAYAASISGKPAEVTTEYRNLTYNPTIEEGTFTLEPPADATIEDESESVSVYKTWSELVDDAGEDLPDPDLPDGYEFAEGSITEEGSNTTLTLHYSRDNGSLLVTKQWPASEGSVADGNETVDVAGHEGQYRETDAGTAVLSWRCEDTAYSVAGQFSKDDLRAIAESMACE